jgi:hypothetical protein
MTVGVTVGGMGVRVGVGVIVNMLVAAAAVSAAEVAASSSDEGPQADNPITIRINSGLMIVLIIKGILALLLFIKRKKTMPVTIGIVERLC